MAAPNPAIRISPSGPLADDNSPFNEFAGAEYVSVQEEDPPGTAAYMAARIGPSSADNAPTAILRRGGAGIPQATPGVDVLASNLVPLGAAASQQAPSNVFGMGAGLWLVEAHISMGYNTSIPVANEHGGLVSIFDLVDDAGSVVQSVAGLALDSTPRAVGAGPVAITAVQVGIVHSTVFRQIIEITDAQVAANSSITPSGAPFRGIQTRLTRVNAGTNYGTESGWLEFTRNCRLSLRRFR